MLHQTTSAFDPVQQNAAILLARHGIVTIFSETSRSWHAFKVGSVGGQRLAFSPGDKQLASSAFQINVSTRIVSLTEAKEFESDPESGESVFPVPLPGCAYLAFVSNSRIGAFGSNYSIPLNLSPGDRVVFAALSPVMTDVVAVVSHKVVLFANIRRQEIVASFHWRNEGATDAPVSAAWSLTGSYILIAHENKVSFYHVPKSVTDVNKSNVSDFIKGIKNSFVGKDASMTVKLPEFILEAPASEVLSSCFTYAGPAVIRTLAVLSLDSAAVGLRDGSFAITLCWTLDAPDSKLVSFVSVVTVRLPAGKGISTGLIVEGVYTVPVEYANPMDSVHQISQFSSSVFVLISEEGVFHALLLSKHPESQLPYPTLALSQNCYPAIPPTLQLLTAPLILASHIDTYPSITPGRLSLSTTRFAATAHIDGSLRLWEFSESGDLTRLYDALSLRDIVPFVDSTGVAGRRRVGEGGHDAVVEEPVVHVWYERESAWLVVSCGAVLAVLKERGRGVEVGMGEEFGELEVDVGVMAELDRVVDQVLGVSLEREKEARESDPEMSEGGDPVAEISDEPVIDVTPLSNDSIAEVSSELATDVVKPMLKKEISSLQMRDLEADTPALTPPVQEPAEFDDKVVKNDAAMVTFIEFACSKEEWNGRWKGIAQVMASGVIEAQAACPELGLVAFGTAYGDLVVVDLNTGLTVLEDKLGTAEEAGERAALIHFENTFFNRESNLRPVMFVATAENALFSYGINLPNTTSDSSSNTSLSPSITRKATIVHAPIKAPSPIRKSFPSSTLYKPHLISILNGEGEPLKYKKASVQDSEHYLVFVGGKSISVHLLASNKSASKLIEKRADRSAAKSDDDGVAGWMGRMFTKKAAPPRALPTADEKSSLRIVKAGVIMLANKAPAVLVRDSEAGVKVFGLPDLDVIVEYVPSEPKATPYDVHILDDGGVIEFFSSANLMVLSHDWDQSWKSSMASKLYDFGKQSAYWKRMGRAGGTVGKDRELEALFKGQLELYSGATESDDALEKPRHEIGSNSTSTNNNAFAETKNKLNERGELLSNLERKFGDLNESSGNFLKTITEYNERQAKKKWYEL
ncbi:hypothetical protein BC830DRAFT_1132694 [Chytriomyces sp. MP71]|nr:hypothetical protein BC830DRAFT_1132694 [Chytriomyces sp. MP71]